MYRVNLNVNALVDIQDAFDQLFPSDQIDFMIDNIECIPDKNIKMEYEKRFGNQVIEEEN